MWLACRQSCWQARMKRVLASGGSTPRTLEIRRAGRTIVLEVPPANAWNVGATMAGPLVVGELIVVPSIDGSWHDVEAEVRP